MYSQTDTGDGRVPEVTLDYEVTTPGVWMGTVRPREG